MIAALLLTGTLVAQATPAAQPAPSPSYFAGACGPTITAYLRTIKNVLPKSIEEATAGDYGMAVFNVKGEGISSSGWFVRRPNQWCLIGFGTDVIAPQSGIRLGVPEDAAQKVFVRLKQLRKGDPD